MGKRILIVGGVAGGASFAARMRRLDEEAQITLFEKGEHISFANCGLPYHVGETIKDRDNLIIQTPKSFRERYNVDIRIESEVISVDAESNTLTVRSGTTVTKESYDYLLLSPGAMPIRPPIPGIDNPRIMTLRNIPDMDRIKERIDTEGTRRVVVVGGGFIGLEMAENLGHRGLDVTLVEALDQVFAPGDKEMANILHQHLLLNGVRLHLGDAIAAAAENTDGTVDIILKSGTRLSADMVLLAIGVRPDTAFLKGSGITLTERGALIVDEHMRTNKPNIFAVGDAVEITDLISSRKLMVPLAGPANRQGRIAADNIAGIPSTYKRTQGTAICKLFDLTVAVTGLNEKNARNWGIPYSKSYTHSASHASYYPGAFPMSIKILFAPDTGKLLGAQIVGKDGIDKRIDVFATALRHGLTVIELSELELAYAPPFGSAKDPVNMAGFVAQNILEKRCSTIFAEDIESRDNATTILLDVRTRAEHEQGVIPGSTLIPLDELRNRLEELDKSKEIIVYCQVGLRGYLASRILTQKGFTARNLSGGYKTWSNSQTLDYDGAYMKPLTEAACSTPSTDATPSAKHVVDATGQQCPGPIMQLKKAIDSAAEGETIEISATDQGFALDVPAWCSRTGNSLISLSANNGVFKAFIKKGTPNTVCAVGATGGSGSKTMVVFSNDLDRAMAAFIIANGAASMGSQVTLFFTFWGLNLLRRDSSVAVKKGLMDRMFGMMMPRGAGKTILSKMHMGGMGTAMMKMTMRNKKVIPLPDLVQQAIDSGVRLVACAMTMDIMGIKKEELIDGVEFGGVATYLAKADEGSYNLFI